MTDLTRRGHGGVLDEQLEACESPAAAADRLSDVVRLLGKPRFKYMELAHRLMHDIAHQGLQPGDRLCTETDLVEEHEFSRTTVRQALAVLEKEGFVWRKHRMGTYVKRAVRLDAKDTSEVRGTVLLVVPESEGLDPESDLASFTIFRSIVRELGGLNFAIQVIALDPNPLEARQQFARVTSSTRFDGICAYASNVEALLDLAPNVPLVTVGTKHPSTGASVDVDIENITYRLVSYLIGRGHRRIAVLGGPCNQHRSFLQLVSGYRRAFDESGLLYTRELLHQSCDDEPLIDLAKAVLRGQKPTAVFAEESQACHAVIAAANTLSINVPDELSIVSYGQMAHRISAPVRITVVLPDNAAVGTEAVRQLAQYIDGHAPANNRVLISAPIAEGGSVRTIDDD